MRRGIIRQRTGLLEMLERAMDGAIVSISLLAVAQSAGVGSDNLYLGLGTVALVLFLVFADAVGVYRVERGSTLGEVCGKLAQAWGGVLLTLLVLMFVTKTTGHFSRRVVLEWSMIVLVATALLRVGARILLGKARRRGYNLRRAAIVGYSEMGRRVASAIDEHPEMGLFLVGCYDDRSLERLGLPEDPALPMKGKLKDLVLAAQEGRIDIVYISWSLRAEARTKELIAQLCDTTASLYLVPDFMMYDLLDAGWPTQSDTFLHRTTSIVAPASWTNLGGLPAVAILETPFSGWNALLKRLEDAVLGPLFLLLFLPVMSVAAVAIKLIDGGPVLFKQARYGLDGKEIIIWKFKTMKVEEGTSFKQATRNDPRVSRLGAFLRRTSIDEMPQFFNVIQGRMSIVGPRPHPVALNEQYRSMVFRYMVRHKVTPGITGLAQINGYRGETRSLESMEKRVHYDLEYIRNWSLLLDLRIIAITTIKGFTGKQAY